MKQALAGKFLAVSIMLGSSMTLTNGIATAQTTDANARFSKLADQYFDQVYFPYAPTSGTQAGFHQYDTKLEDYSRAGIDSQIEALHAFLPKVEQFDPSTLNQTTRGDPPGHPGQYPFDPVDAGDDTAVAEKP